MNKKIKLLLPFFVSVSVVIMFWLKRIVLLKFYPVVCNLFVFTVFFVSLFTKETVIQKIAKTMEGELTEKVRVYTRKLTYVWCVFISLNFVISVITIFLPDNYWILYNGFISYILVGLMFIAEYIVRITLRKRNLL